MHTYILIISYLVHNCLKTLNVLFFKFYTHYKFYFHIKMSKFVRSESVKYPQIYSTFTAKDKDSDVIVSYRVQDLPEEYFEKAVDLMVKHFLDDETFCVCRKLVESEKGVEEFRVLWQSCFTEKLSLACFKDATNELISVNALMVNIQDVNDEHNVSFLN